MHHVYDQHRGEKMLSIKACVIDSNKWKKILVQVEIFIDNRLETEYENQVKYTPRIQHFQVIWTWN